MANNVSGFCCQAQLRQNQPTCNLTLSITDCIRLSPANEWFSDTRCPESGFCGISPLGEGIAIGAGLTFLGGLLLLMIVFICILGRRRRIQKAKPRLQENVEPLIENGEEAYK
jgi:hypothetical protein